MRALPDRKEEDSTSWVRRSTTHPHMPIFSAGDGGEKDKGPSLWHHLPQQHLIVAISLLLLEGDGVASDSESVSMGSLHDHNLL